MQAKIHFNQHTKPKSLHIGANVYIRNYRSKRKWLHGSIVGRQSDVLWNVKVDGRSNVWVRHADQLRLTAKLSAKTNNSSTGTD